MNGNINNRQGYTLLEVLVVLALLSIIMSIAVPDIKVISRFEEKQEIKNFKKDIFYIRNKAILEGQAYTLHIDDKKTFYSISNESKLIKKIYLKHLEFLPENTLNSNVRFFPSGSPDKGGTFSLKNKKGTIIEFRISPVTGKLNLY